MQTTRLNIRCTGEQLERLKALADQANLTLSRFVLTRALGEEPTPAVLTSQAKDVLTPRTAQVQSVDLPDPKPTPTVLTPTDSQALAQALSDPPTPSATLTQAAKSTQSPLQQMLSARPAIPKPSGQAAKPSKRSNCKVTGCILTPDSSGHCWKHSAKA